MQPGWYSHVQNRQAVAYFDGTRWGSVRDGATLDRVIQGIITPLQPGHPGPRAPFESKEFAPPKPPKPPKPSKPAKAGSGWWWGIGAGALLLVWGLANGFLPAGSSCGAPFVKSHVAEYMDALSQDNGLGYSGYAASCRASIADATVMTWILIVLGVLVAMGSIIVMAVLRSGNASKGAVMPTTAAQIEDLARLRDKGLVTAQEFEWKRQEFLRRS